MPNKTKVSNPTKAYGQICLSGTSLVGVVHGVRVAPSLAFYGSDPMYLLRVLVYKMTVELVLCTRSISYRGQLTI